jgi:hypothetical protein
MDWGRTVSRREKGDPGESRDGMKSPELAANVRLTNQRARKGGANALVRPNYSRAFHGHTSFRMAKMLVSTAQQSGKVRLLLLLSIFPVAAGRESCNKQEVLLARMLQKDSVRRPESVSLIPQRIGRLDTPEDLAPAGPKPNIECAIAVTRICSNADHLGEAAMSSWEDDRA